jgi:uncharacterized protein (DUF1499 family)
MSVSLAAIRPMTVSLAAFGIAVLGLLLLALAGPAYRALDLELPTAFTVLRWAAYIGLTGAVAATAAGVFAFRRGTRVPMAVAVAAVIVGLTVAGVPYAWQRRAQGVPPIHDISTDLENPPAFDAVVPLRADAPNSLERPPELAAQQREGYPDIAPITLAAPLNQAFERALAVAQDKGWEIVTADQSSGRIEATDTTFWFGFVDDIVVRLTPWGSGTRVDARSVSRLGRGDAGTNARRIHDFLESLEDE